MTYKAIGVIVILLLAGTIKAQVTVNINVGTPPPWGPVGYTEVRYYYLPAVEAYYDVHTAMFIYYSRGAWLHRHELPGRYRNYDLYHGYKMVMHDYRGDTPYIHFKEHKVKYNKSYKSSPQRTIGEKPGNGKPKSDKAKDGKGKKGKNR